MVTNATPDCRASAVTVQGLEVQVVVAVVPSGLVIVYLTLVALVTESILTLSLTLTVLDGDPGIRCGQIGG